jgi:hypothetical protein
MMSGMKNDSWAWADSDDDDDGGGYDEDGDDILWSFLWIGVSCSVALETSACTSGNHTRNYDNCDQFRSWKFNIFNNRTDERE